MTQKKININSLYKAIKHYENFIDENGEITNQEQHNVCYEMIKNDLDMFIGEEIRDELQEEAKKLKSIIKNHIHKNGKVYIEM